MSKPTPPRLPRDWLDELEGRNWHIAVGGRHFKLFVDGRFIMPLSLNGDFDRGRLAINGLANLRRALKEPAP